MMPHFIVDRDYNIWEDTESLFVVKYHNNLLWTELLCFMSQFTAGLQCIVYVLHQLQDSPFFT